MAGEQPRILATNPAPNGPALPGGDGVIDATIIISTSNNGLTRD
ncbi:hypothetical protein AB0M41_44970 [Streptomyces sp. NPDC051896]